MSADARTPNTVVIMERRLSSKLGTHYESPSSPELRTLSQPNRREGSHIPCHAQGIANLLRPAFCIAQASTGAQCWVKTSSSLRASSTFSAQRSNSSVVAISRRFTVASSRAPKRRDIWRLSNVASPSNRPCCMPCCMPCCIPRCIPCSKPCFNPSSRNRSDKVAMVLVS